MQKEWFDEDTGKWFPVEEIEIEGELRPARILPFKPSNDQLIRYMKFKNHPVPWKKVKDERKRVETGAQKELVKVWKKTKDPLYKAVLDYRGCETAVSRYVDGWNPGEDGRVHGEFMYVPASGQLNSVNPNCFSADTELLTDKGWIRFDQLNKTEKVAQFGIEEKTITFAEPTAFIEKEFIGSLRHITTEQQIDLLVTLDHDCLVQARNGEFSKIKALNYPEDHKQYHAGQFIGGNQSFRDSQLILMAALQADGHILRPIVDKKGRKRGQGGHIKFGFTKERKITRLRNALLSEQIPFTEKTKTQTTFYISRENVPDWLKDKKFFNSWLLNLDRNAMDFMSEEIWFWDGFAEGRTMYSSSIKSNADWAQILSILSGRRAKIRKYPTLRGMPNWQVDAVDSDFSWTTNRMITHYPYAGQVYCVSMPKGTVIVRRNGKVAITGQCQNFIKHGAKDGANRKYANGLRNMISAPSGFTLAELDFSAFHGVTTGFEARDKDYMRLARLDIHSFLTAHFVYLQKLILASDLPDVNWSDEQLGLALSDIKKRFPEIRDVKAKPATLGIGFGMGANKLYVQNDETMTLREAKTLMKLMEDLFPIAKKWRGDIKILADRQGYLVSRFGFVRWFWDVFSRKMVDGKWVVGNGSDAEDAIAFLPSNDGHGHMQSTMVSLEKLGANEKFGLINMIHDSLLYLMPDNLLSEGVNVIRNEMMKPSSILVDSVMAPQGLSFGVDVKVGKSWDKMEKWKG